MTGTTSDASTVPATTCRPPSMKRCFTVDRQPHPRRENQPRDSPSNPERLYGAIGFVISGQWKVTFGIAAGLLLGTLLWLRESPPARIQNWRWGSDGERKTARALRRLLRIGGAGTIFNGRTRPTSTTLSLVAKASSCWTLRTASGTLPSTTMAFTFSGSNTPRWYPNTVESLRKKGVRERRTKGADSGRHRGEDMGGTRSRPLGGSSIKVRLKVNNVTFVRGSELVDWLCATHPQRRRFDVARVSALLDTAASHGLGPRPRPTR